MSDIVSDLAAKAGVSPEQAKKGLGTVLSFLKEALPAESFAKVNAAVPGSEQMMAAAGEPGPSGGGIIGSIKEMAGKLFGGGGVAALVAKLSSLGLSAEQAESFIPKVIEFLKARLPESVMKQLSEHLPTPQTTSP
jgi:uncharacterized protein (DUF2267 family)